MNKKPLITKVNKDAHLNLRVYQTAKNKIDYLCEQNNISITEFVENAIDKGYETDRIKKQCQDILEMFPDLETSNQLFLKIAALYATSNTINTIFEIKGICEEVYFNNSVKKVIFEAIETTDDKSLYLDSLYKAHGYIEAERIYNVIFGDDDDDILGYTE